MGTQTHDVIKGRAKYVLILIVLLNMLYPITGNGSLISLIGFASLYAGLFIVGIFITSESRAQITWSISIAVIWLVMTVVYALDPTSFWKTQVSSFMLIVFHTTMILVLMRYIFTAEQVTADVIYAACAVYLLLSFFFVPVYGMLEAALPGSFVDNTLNGPVRWQQFVYYSLVTLSTAGYGDILPSNMWARMLAGLEATIGVLYVAILVARLVSLYEVRRRN
jgi:hypothetical protein